MFKKTDDLNYRWLLFAFILGTLILGVKSYAYFLTNSSSLLSDALESIVNVLAGFIALLAYRFSLRPQDENHPYGHGKVQFLSSGLEAILILIAGIALILKATYHLYQPQEIQHLPLGLLICTIMGAMNFLLGYFLIQRGKQTHSLLLEGNGRHLQADAYTSLALLLGVGITYFTGWVMIDNLCAIVFSFFIIFTGLNLAQKSLAGIMDEQDSALIKNLSTQINSKRKFDWIDLHNFRIIKYGQQFHIDCHLTIPWFYTIEQGHETMEEFHQVIKEILPNTEELFVHMDPCTPRSCPSCLFKQCPKRQQNFVQQIHWNADNIVRNQKHHL